MSKSLVIVESPAKAKTINRYLGSQYIVKSSVGHVRDLPTGGSKPKKKTKKTIFDKMGIYPEDNWQADYQVLPGKEKVVEELKKAAAKAPTVFLATDLDREGEAIAWHLQQIINADADNFQRVIFNEITKPAIQKAFQNPGKIDAQKVNAQQTRRFLDRLVGFLISPLLWQKVSRGLSAGRVQSVATKLIVEREQEIQKFVPQEFWRLYATLASAGESVEFEVTKYQGKKFYPTSREQIQQHENELQKHTFLLEERTVKPANSRPSPPFITSTLQQAASTRLGFSVKRTMIAAQKLYEAGFITYMRTDSTNISTDAMSTVREYIGSEYGKAYLPETPRFYASKAAAQEAHEAIRPTSLVSSDPSSIRDGEKLYQLIRRRFIASQMTDARYENTSLKVRAGDFILEAKGRVRLFDGYTRVFENSTEKDLQVLPAMKENETLTKKSMRSSQHFTKPQPRYSEATLVRELEKRNIGRPSTYAPIISTIQERGYVNLRNKRFHAEKIGEIVTNRLNTSFPNLMDYNFTGSMEKQLDAIAEGELDWKNILDNFYNDLVQKIEQAQGDKNGMKQNTPLETPIHCERCDRTMVLRYSSSGAFLGCSGYSLPKEEKCNNTLNLIACDELPQAEPDADKHQLRQLQEQRRCRLCNKSMKPYLIDNSRKFHLCSNSPECAGMELETGQFVIPNSDAVSEYTCDVCGNVFVIKSGRFGKYFSCSGEDCGETRSILASGKPSPKKMKPVPMPELACKKVDDHYVLRDGANGMFLAASKFPKHRETRPALVNELLPHRDEIDSKYHFLLDGPHEDPDGNPAQIRYSKKHQCQYLTSEINGKQSNWAVFYSDADGWSTRK